MVARAFQWAQFAVAPYKAVHNVGGAYRLLWKATWFCSYHIHSLINAFHEIWVAMALFINFSCHLHLQAYVFIVNILCSCFVVCVATYFLHHIARSKRFPWNKQIWITTRVLQAGNWNFERGLKPWKITQNDHFEAQKCHFWAFLASFKISFSGLHNPKHNLVWQDGPVCQDSLTERHSRKQ